MMTASVLILEDEPVVALGLEMALKDQGFENVVVCNSIWTAMSEIKKRVPRAAIIDFMEDGGASSVDVAQRLVQQSCKVVFVADFAEDARDLPYTLQDCAVIEKPFRDEDVVEKLGLVVDKGASLAS